MSPYLASDVPEPFVGRDAILDRMRRTVAGWQGRSACLILLHGTAAIGSTATALCYSREYEELFGDGVIHLKVAEAGLDQAAPIGELLDVAMRQLTEAPQEIPDADEARAVLYHRCTRNKRVLVLIDGVTVPEQVAPLVPRSPHAVVVVTGRRRFDLLSGHEAINVPPLAEAASRQLLTRLLADEIRQIGEPTLAALLRLCAGHPLAIRIVASAVREQPGYAERFLGDARERGVAVFEANGVQLVAAALDAMYEGLTADQAAAYRRLALHPGADFGIPAAAALLELSVADTERLLHGLVALNLLGGGRDGRYRWNALVRRHAEQLAVRVEAAESRRRATWQVLDWYRRSAVAASARATFRWWDHLAVYRQIPAADCSRDEAVGFLDVEQPNLEAAVRLAAELGFPDVARDLCFPLWTPYHLHRQHTSAVDTYRIGIEAAAGLDDRAAVMQLDSQLGAVHLALGELPDARRRFEHSLELARALTHGLGTQSALEWLGKTAIAAGDVGLALRRYDESWQVTVPAGQMARVRALLSLHRARAFMVADRPAEAIDALQIAQAYFDGTTDNDNRAKTRYELGRAARAAADGAGARAPLAEALSLFTADRSTRMMANTRLELADAERAVRLADPAVPGSVVAEVEHLTAARDLLSLLHDDEAVSTVQRRLDELRT